MDYTQTKPVFTKNHDGSFTPTEEAHLLNDIFSMISGKPKSTISPYRIPEGGFGQGGGFVAFAEPNKARVDPLNKSGHVLAHELAHIHLQTDLGKKNAHNHLNSLDPMKPGDIPPLHNPNKGAGLRHHYEMYIAPTLIEEASAQGGAYGVMELLGYGSPEIHQARRKKISGWNTPTAYPQDFTNKYLNRLKINPLHKESRKDPSWQQELANIKQNASIRANREFEKSRNRVLNFIPDGGGGHTLKDISSGIRGLATSLANKL